MKKNKRTIALIFFVLLTLMLSSTAVFGAEKQTFKVVKISANRWISVKTNKRTWGEKNSRTTVNMYQIKVPSSGYLTIQWKSKQHYTLYMYDKKKYSNYWEDDIAEFYNNGKTSGTYRIAVEKGTYYLATSSSSGDPEKIGQFRYSFTKVKHGTNYSPGTAQKLKAGKQVTVCLTPQNAYSRWYKITLPKKKSLSVWCTGYDNGNKSSYPGNFFEICDSDLETVYMERAGSESPRYYSEDYLEAGTYYIRVYNYYYYDDVNNRNVITIKWK